MRADDPRSTAQSRSVQDMFQRIAPHYDLMNRLMTGGQDVYWRKIVIRWAQIPPQGRVQALGTGTGDLAQEALRRVPGCKVTAADFTLKMMLVGKQRPDRMHAWAGADALNLPFPDNTFDAVISGFLLRNVVDLQCALEEQLRVLKPGGRLVALDTTRPKPSPFSPFIHFYMRRFIPFLGGLLTGSREAYVYLPTTSENFLWAEDLKTIILSTGFEHACFKRLMFGTIAIHCAEKPA